MRQLDDGDLCRSAPGGGNSIATIAWHVSGNLKSRFTDFLTSDGEKTWRNEVHEALHRSLAHVAYHVGQIVYAARALAGESWQYMSIPPGQSESYNLNPTLEKSPDSQE